MGRPQLLFALLISFLIMGSFPNAKAQPCQPPQPTGNAGFKPDWTNLQCIHPGQSFNATINLEVPTTWTGVSIDSIRLDSIGINHPQDTLDAVADFNGLPNGISYVTSNGTPVNTWLPGETGCITFSGTTNDPIGNYQLGIWVTVWLPTQIDSLNNVMSSIFSKQTGNSLNIPYHLKIRKQGSPCTDTINLSCNGTTTLSSCQGSFEDGSVTDNYKNNTNCGWLIDPPNADSIRLTFNSFSTEKSGDEVTVYDGPTTSAPVLGTFSGFTIPKPVTSSGGEMLVRFTTDASGTAQGWNATYNCSTGGGNISCVPLKPNDDPGFTPNWTNLYCVRQGQSFNATIKIKTPFSDGGNTLFDSIRLDSIGIIAPQDTLDAVADYSGLPNGISYVTSNGTPVNTWLPGETGCITLSGTTNDSIGNYQLARWVTMWSSTFPNSPFKGELNQIGKQLQLGNWNFPYYYLKVRQQGNPCYDTVTNACINPVTFSNCQGNFDDGSGTNNYVNNRDCAWLIDPPNADSVRVNFTSFDTENGDDEVTLYDGPTTAAPVLGTFSGSSIPKQVTSSGGEMLVRFTTDGSVTGKGWAATYNCNTGGGSFNCAPPQPTGNPGLSPDWTQLSCIERGNSYSAVINFENWNSLAGQTIDSLRLDSVGIIAPQDTLDTIADFNGPPSGINFTTSNGTSSNIWQPSETGCIEVTGTTNDSVGNYQLGFWVTIWTPIVQQPFSGDLNTIGKQFGTNSFDSYYLKVRQPGSPCQDTLACQSLSLNTSIQNVMACDSTNGSIAVTASGGTPPYSYQWSNGQNGATISGLPAGTYTVSVTDSSNCMETSTETISVINGNPCVWPGDANNDGIVNNTDLLSIGTAHGSTGPARATISTLWEPKKATPWSNNFGNGVNYKHADCNGDGIVNNQDSAAVSQNYSKTPNKGSLNNHSQGPPVSIDLQADSVFAGETLQVPVRVGSANQPVSNLYGLAFSVNYTDGVIKDNSVSFVRSDNSWLSSQGTNLLSINKELTSMAKLDIALTKTDQQNGSGSGKIGYVEMTVADDLSASSGKTLQLSVSDIHAINAQESSVPLQGESDTTQAFDKSTFVNSSKNISSVSIYPNPTTGHVTIDGIEDMSVKHIKVLNVLGEIQERIVPDNNRSKMALQTQEWPEGIYFVTITNEKGATINKKLVLNK